MWTYPKTLAEFKQNKYRRIDPVMYYSTLILYYNPVVNYLYSGSLVSYNYWNFGIERFS